MAEVNTFSPCTATEQPHTVSITSMGGSTFRRRQIRLMKIKRFLLPPSPTAARDIVQDRRDYAALAKILLGSTWIIALAASILTVAKLLWFFKGDLSAVSLVLEVGSFPAIVRLTLITLTIAMLPTALISLAHSLGTSHRTRLTTWIFLLLGFLAYLTAFMTPFLIFTCLGFYLEARASDRRKADKSKTIPPSSRDEFCLKSWASRNRHHEDHVMRSLAQQAVRAKQSELHAIESRIKERSKKLAPTSLQLKLRELVRTLNIWLVVIIVIPARFSADYSVQISEEPATHTQLLMADGRVLLVNPKKATVRLVKAEEIRSLDVCSTKPDDSASWLYRPAFPTPHKAIDLRCPDD